MIELKINGFFRLFNESSINFQILVVRYQIAADSKLYILVNNIS